MVAVAWLLCRCDKPRTEPSGEVLLRQGAGRRGFNGADGLGRVEAHTVAVVGEEDARHHPGGALVAVHEAVVARKAVEVRRC